MQKLGLRFTKEDALEEIRMLLAGGCVDLDARGLHVTRDVLFRHVVKRNGDGEHPPRGIVLHRRRGTF